VGTDYGSRLAGPRNLRAIDFMKRNLEFNAWWFHNRVSSYITTERLFTFSSKT
jgi:hypothetical protein